MDKAQQAMIEEMLQEASESHPSIVPNETKKNEIVDADFTRVAPAPKKEEPAVETQTPQSSSAGLDWAVTAAKKMAREKKKKEMESTASPTNENMKTSTNPADFAVAAAEKIARERQSTVKPRATVTKKKKKKKKKKGASTNRSEATAASGYKRAFEKTTLSTPEMFAARMKQKSESKDKTKSNAKTVAESKGSKVKGVKAKGSTHTEASDSIQEATTKDPEEKNFKINMKTVEKEEGIAKVVNGKAKSKNKTERADGNKDMPSDEDIMRTAQEVMAEIADQQDDMSAEDLLQDVMDFGEKQDQQNQVGSGFVSGALEKAKELLRENKRKAEVRAAATKTDAAAAPPNEGPQVRSREISSEEEELRRMFEAGERIADGRISLATDEKKQGNLSDLGADANDAESEVDELIARDKTVSDHARVIDDELVELAVRINQHPDSEFDGPPQNPLFDVFSGPEVYNPNVDPETAVNWPGALPGTKTDVENKLPKELAEAVKQAKFAAEVLQQLEVKDESESDRKRYFVGNRELSESQVLNLQTVVEEAVEIGLIPNPLVLLAERSRLQMVIDELWNQPEERYRDIVSEYKDLLLSDNFVALIQERLEAMAERDLESIRQRSTDDDVDTDLAEAHARERELLSLLVNNAQLLLKEARALGSELEAQHIEVIRSICKVAMDPSHITEEETAAALSDAVRDMRPLFDDMFVSYLKYAVAEEEGRLARAGLLDDPEHNQWLFVLKIVQQGVYAEIAKGINRYIEHIWYVLRMETPTERKMLLERLVDVMPTLDVRPFVKVVNNIVGSLGEAAKGDFDGVYELGKMANKLLQLHRDLKEILPPERIDEMSRDADEWAAKRREQMMEQRKLTKQRLAAARDTEEYDEEVESIGRRGEVERFDNF